MRGKPNPITMLTFGNGITPADAGKTQSYKYALSVIQDHPRGCGENAKSVQRRA